MTVRTHLWKFCFNLRRSLALHHRWGADVTSGPGHGTKRISKKLVSDNEQDQNPVLQLSLNKIGLLQMILLLLTSSSSSFILLLLLARFVLDMPMEGNSPISSLFQAVFYSVSRHSSLLHSSSFRVKNLLVLGHPTGLFP